VVETAAVRAHLCELIVTIAAGDRETVVARWNAAFPPAAAPVDGAGGWPWQRNDASDMLRVLFQVATASVWAASAERWPAEDELEVLTRKALEVGGWRAVRMTSDILTFGVPKSQYSRLGRPALHKQLTRSLLHEIVDRPLNEPVREPFPFMTSAATLLIARLLGDQPEGAGAAFDRVVAALDDASHGPNLVAEATRVFYRVYPGFTRAKISPVERDALRDLVAGFIAADVPRFAAAIGLLGRSSSKEHRQQVDRALMDGATRMFSTPDGRLPTRERIAELVDQARARGERETGGLRVTDEDAAAARALLEVCAGLLPRVGLTRGLAVALAKLTALEALDRGDGRALERFAQIEWLFFDVCN
jgi:hypothetical protein